MNSRGMSVMEMMISLAVASVVVTGVVSVLVMLFTSSAGSQKRLDGLEGLSLIKLNFGRAVGGGQLRGYFFTGNAAPPLGMACGSCTATGTDRVFGRTLIPMPGLCRDLKTKCANAVTMLVGSSQKTTGDQLALCLLNNRQILVTSAEIKGPLISLLSPPSSSLWRVTSAAQPLNVDPATGAPLSEDCVATLRRLNYGGLPAGPFFTIDVSPVTGIGVTSGSCVCDGHKAQAVAEYPARIMTTEISSLGPMPEGGSFDWGLSSCTVSTTGQVLNCSASAGVAVHQVANVEVQERFQVKDLSSAVDWYVLNSAADVTACTTGKCALMSVNLPLQGAFPSETFTTFDFSRFSLIKQDILQTIRFQVRKDDGKLVSAQFEF